MTLQEQLEKTEKDLEKVEEKRTALQKKRKSILAKIEEENMRERGEKNQEIVDIIRENFGEITEENIGRFKEIMRQNNLMGTIQEEPKEKVFDGEAGQGNWTETHTG